MDIADATFDGITSAGAFTHGHLGPEPLGELIRIAKPEAVFAVGVNAGHYEAAGFAAWFDEAQASGRIRDFEVVTSPIYDPDRYEADDAADHAGTLLTV